MEDAAKGLEPQTRKLFEVAACGRSRFSRSSTRWSGQAETLELLDEIEKELELLPRAVNWPIGSGEHFQVIDRYLASPVRAG